MQQIPLSLKENLFSLSQIGTLGGVQCALEVASFNQDFENSKKGGFFDLSNWGVIRISGPDASSYLQRMSTADIKLLEIGKAIPGAFLTGKGTLVAFGTFFRNEESSFLFVLDPGQTSRTVEHLDLFHFQEKLEFLDESEKWAVLGLWNLSETTFNMEWKDFKREALRYVLLPREEACTQMKSWFQKGISFLGMRLFHYFRILHGIPWMGWEAQPGDLILEVGLEDFVVRNKGCYPGQEVVERIFSYGQVNRKLLRVELETSSLGTWLKAPIEINQSEEKVGQLLSFMERPTEPQKACGLAMIRKPFWAEKREYEIATGIRLSLVG